MQGDPLLDSLPSGASPDPEQTLVLLRRAQGGDREALNALCARYEERVRRVVRVRLGPALRRWTESGDVVQEVFREALRRIGTLEFTNELDLLDWLSRVATHRIRDLVDHFAAQKRDVGRQESVDLQQSGRAVQLFDERSTPSEVAFRREVRALLDEVVGGLPESYREVILLRDYQGASWEDLAQRIRAPTLHAAQQLHQRAWIKVRRLAEPRLAGLRPG